MSKPTIVAHRGLHEDHPENSLEALLAAWRAGFEWCECDIRGSVEHEPLLLHDESLDRTTTGHGRVNETSSTILQAANLRYADGSIAPSSVPRLASVLTSMPPHAKLLIEIKPHVARDVTHNTLDLCNPARHAVQSFDPQVLSAAYAHRPGVRLELLVEDAARPIPVGPWKAVNAQFKTLTEESIRRIRGMDYAVGAWTVNEDADVARILELGVDRIITDRPRRVRDICEQIG